MPVKLKIQTDKLDDIPAPFRDCYEKVGDKYLLATEGEHPKVSEFRTTNTNLMAELEPLRATVKKFEGIDPAVVAADKARLTEFEKATPRITELETALATERTARVELQKKAEASQVESAIGDAFLKSGGRPEARAFIIAQAAGQFTAENGQVKSNKISPNHPGQPMSVDEWLTLQAREHAYLFYASVGGGATGSKGGGATGGGKVLKNPTPQELGSAAADIKAGKVRVDYSS